MISDVEAPVGDTAATAEGTSDADMGVRQRMGAASLPYRSTQRSACGQSACRALSKCQQLSVSRMLLCAKKVAAA